MTSLSLTGKQWRIGADFRTRGGRDIVSALAAERGIDMARAPLPPDSPLTPPDLARACGRILRAVRTGECIGIFGDYDCDGITSVAQLVRFFRRRGIEPLARLPHRQQEGYGLKKEAVAFFAKAGVTLLLTVDTGVTALAEIEAARVLGMETVIVDHHHLPPTLPPAVAILHPALADPSSPQPSAAGMVFGLLSALEGGAWQERDTDLALATIGTVADLVELRGVNRTIVTEGLEALARLRSGSLHDLLVQAGITGRPTSRDVGYRVAPRLNAAGRMADPAIALAALLGDGEALARLERLNRERQEAVQEILRELDVLDASAPFLSVASPDYPAGILGLLAGKLTERHSRPSMVVQIQGDVCVGSLRSIPGFHVAEALRACSDLLLTFGGHALAAGCTFSVAALRDLQARLSERVTATLPAAFLRPTLAVDGILPLSAVSLPLCRTLAALEPFGQGNPEPRFLLPEVRLGGVRPVGRDGAHLQATAGSLKLVGFGLGRFASQIPFLCDIACRIGIDTWNGNERPQIYLEDIRVHAPEFSVAAPSVLPVHLNGTFRRNRASPK